MKEHHAKEHHAKKHHHAVEHENKKRHEEHHMKRHEHMRHKHAAMEHHGAKMEHHAKKGKGEMQDNRMVKDDHQEGIGRVLQRPGDLDVGQHGKMYNKPVGGQAHWERPEHGASTPRGA